ncbi:MAG: hypothetical protein NWS63_07615, partial [Saprospiraceae bacterium]|nr:hypothetical protein [Saprospiraceae bacterium]
GDLHLITLINTSTSKKVTSLCCGLKVQEINGTLGTITCWKPSQNDRRKSSEIFLVFTYSALAGLHSI